MTLLLNQLFYSSQSGIVKIAMPSNKNFKPITGILVSDPAIKVRNQWGSILPGGEDLNDLMAVAGSRNLFAWVAGSSAAWKSSDPLGIGLDFYLLSYDRSSDVKGQARSLLSLATMGEPEGGSFAQATMVSVHGGYKIDVSESNQALRTDNAITDAYLQGMANQLTGDKEGTLTIQIGDQITLKNMLLEECSAEHSKVQVERGIPLFIKISATFRLCRAPLTSDIEGIYG